MSARKCYDNCYSSAYFMRTLTQGSYKLKKFIPLLCLSLSLSLTGLAATHHKMPQPYTIRSVCTYTQDQANHIDKRCKVSVHDRQGRLMGQRELHSGRPGYLKALVLRDINPNASTFSWATDRIAAPCPDCAFYIDQWGGNR